MIPARADEIRRQWAQRCLEALDDQLVEWVGIGVEAEFGPTFSDQDRSIASGLAAAVLAARRLGYAITQEHSEIALWAATQLSYGLDSSSSVDARAISAPVSLTCIPPGDKSVKSPAVDVRSALTRLTRAQTSHEEVLGGMQVVLDVVDHVLDPGRGRERWSRRAVPVLLDVPGGASGSVLLEVAVESRSLGEVVPDLIEGWTYTFEDTSTGFREAWRDTAHDVDTGVRWRLNRRVQALEGRSLTAAFAVAVSLATSRQTVDAQITRFVVADAHKGRLMPLYVGADQALLDQLALKFRAADRQAKDRGHQVPSVVDPLMRSQTIPAELIMAVDDAHDEAVLQLASEHEVTVIGCETVEAAALLVLEESTERRTNAEWPGHPELIELHRWTSEQMMSTAEPWRQVVSIAQRPHSAFDRTVTDRLERAAREWRSRDRDPKSGVHHYATGIRVDKRESTATESFEVTLSSCDYSEWLSVVDLLDEDPAIWQRWRSEIELNGPDSVLSSWRAGNVNMNVVVVSLDGYLLVLRRSSGNTLQPNVHQLGVNEMMASSGSNLFDLARRALRNEAGIEPAHYDQIALSWVGLNLPYATLHVVGHVWCRLDRQQIRDRVRNALERYETSRIEFVPIAAVNVARLLRADDSRNRSVPFVDLDESQPPEADLTSDGFPRKWIRGITGLAAAEAWRFRHLAVQGTPL